jgi:hypothetical protein
MPLGKDDIGRFRVLHVRICFSCAAFQFLPCEEVEIIILSASVNAAPEWWNWQTRCVQGAVNVSSCGFKSHLRHNNKIIVQIYILWDCRPKSEIVVDVPFFDAILIYNFYFYSAVEMQI